MRKSILLFTITLFTFATTIHAQPDSLWSRTFGGEYGDYCFSMIQTDDGGFALAGYTSSFGVGEFDMWLLKTDDEGDSLWSRTFGGEGDDFCYSIIQTVDGGYALVGLTSSFGAGRYDMWLVKTDDVGDSLWSQTYGGEEEDYCYSIIQTADSGFALAGFTRSFGAGEYDMWLVKTDADGDSLWSQTFGGRYSDRCNSVIQTTDGGYALAGQTSSFRARTADIWLVRTNEDGDSLWSRSFGGEGEDICYSIIQTADGGYALAGRTRSIFAERIGMWLVKTNADGDSLWSRTFGGRTGDDCNSIIQTEDGGYALAGFTYSFGAGRYDMWLVRTDADGDSLWSRTFGGEEWEYCNSIIQTTDGGYALAGVTTSFGAGSEDFWLVKTGPDPVSVPSESFIPPPSSFILYPAYPNPFNSTITISYSLPFASQVSLQVFNLSGRSVVTLVDGNLQPGFRSVSLNADGLPSGLYFIRLETSCEVFTQKVALTR